MSLKGKTAVVTGAASGIGKATALELARAGARVIMADINEQRGAETQREAQAAGLPAEYLKVDITDAESVTRFAGEALKRAGRVDILVNAPAGAGPNPSSRTLPNSGTR